MNIRKQFLPLSPGVPILSIIISGITGPMITIVAIWFHISLHCILLVSVYSGHSTTRISILTWRFINPVPTLTRWRVPIFISRTISLPGICATRGGILRPFLAIRICISSVWWPHFIHVRRHFPFAVILTICTPHLTTFKWAILMAIRRMLYETGECKRHIQAHIWGFCW